jgi:hypothetical protein
MVGRAVRMRSLAGLRVRSGDPLMPNALRAFVRNRRVNTDWNHS